MDTTVTTQSNRRSFLATVSAGTAGLVLAKPKTVFGSPANSKITFGIIGSGGRGGFVWKKFRQNTPDDVQLISICDYFQDRMDSFQERFSDDHPKVFRGLHSYREVLNSDIDAVVITTPPYFHPEQAAAAVEAGKHLWLAKPVGVDVPGCTSIKESGKKADGKSVFLVDFQSRNSPFFVEAVRRVREGAIGEMVSGEAFNHFPAAGKPDRKEMTESEYRLRCYPTDRILSGDDVVDQAVHAMDIMDWIIGTHPTKAYGTGGLKVRLNNGTNWDHFTVTYWYGDGPVIDLNCSRFVKRYNNLGGRVFGSLGVLHAHYCSDSWGTGPVAIVGEPGKNDWEGTERDNTWDIGINNNCKDFIRAIRSGKYMNHAEDGANSTLTSILGRTASYQNRVVTWDEMLAANEKLELDFQLG
ncbi:MAG TPA: Gfo/Idh/MocA family oxidoreductase [bacterium]|nr:Gfo/Idh/MocA family oxidoreductase [bacterium]